MTSKNRSGGGKQARKGKGAPPEYGGLRRKGVFPNRTDQIPLGSTVIVVDEFGNMGDGTGRDESMYFGYATTTTTDPRRRSFADAIHIRFKKITKRFEDDDR